MISLFTNKLVAAVEEPKFGKFNHHIFLDSRLVFLSYAALTFQKL